MIAKVKKLIPRGAKVTAGPRLASMLIPDYDIYLKFSTDEKVLQPYVLIENFFAHYFPENELSRYLIRSPHWELIHQEFVDERSVQLFRRSEKPLKKLPPVQKIPENIWIRSGFPVPVSNALLEIRAAQISPVQLRIGARIKQKCRNDAAFRVYLEFASGSTMKYFTSFCHGRYPADLAEPGDTFFFHVDIPANEQVTKCRIDVLDLAVTQAPQQ